MRLMQLSGKKVHFALFGVALTRPWQVWRTYRVACFYIYQAATYLVVTLFILKEFVRGTSKELLCDIMLDICSS